MCLSPIKSYLHSATPQKADVRNEAEVKAFVDECVSRYGRLDIAFNNAGIDRAPLLLWQIPQLKFGMTR